MDKDNDSFNMKETFKQGLGGGILGSFLGVPGLGMTLGMINANKKPIKKFANDIDNRFSNNLRYRQDGSGPHGRGFGPGKGTAMCNTPMCNTLMCSTDISKEKKDKKSAMDDPASFF